MKQIIRTSFILIAALLASCVSNPPIPEDIAQQDPLTLALVTASPVEPSFRNVQGVVNEALWAAFYQAEIISKMEAVSDKSIQFVLEQKFLNAVKLSDNRISLVPIQGLTLLVQDSKARSKDTSLPSHRFVAEGSEPGTTLLLNLKTWEFNAGPLTIPEGSNKRDFAWVKVAVEAQLIDTASQNLLWSQTREGIETIVNRRDLDVLDLLGFWELALEKAVKSLVLSLNKDINNARAQWLNTTAQ